MADENGSGSSTDEKTYTQSEVNRIVRDRLDRERGKYADYEELKARAAEADKSKTQLDRLQEQMTELTTRAKDSDRRAMLADVAEELKVSLKDVQRLRGDTKEDLLADGKEFFSRYSTKSGDNDSSNRDTNDNTSSNDNQRRDDESSRRAPRTSRSRPREDLRSGAPVTTDRQPEKIDPRSLAALLD